MKENFLGIYDRLKVLVTGHTGFKGAWLSLWLKELGADVIGYSLHPPTEPNLFTLCDLEGHLTHIHGDIRDAAHFNETMQQHQPDLVFHLAAQPLVLDSYRTPAETFEVNVQGSVNILEAIRHCPSVKAAVMITTDKVYENREQLQGYRESDRLGGDDPYSASKSMAEMAIHSYRTSFFDEGPAVASARAGNVIGGGDFAANRLIPDTMKALMQKKPVVLRNPDSVRPWMHVLDPLSGYLWLGAKLLMERKPYAEAWNFAPQDGEAIPCRVMVEKAIELWGDGDWVDASEARKEKEMKLLQLNGEKAMKQLQWRPTYHWEESIRETTAWFKAFEKRQRANDNSSMYEICCQHLANYIATAKEKQQPWSEMDQSAAILN